MTWLWTTPPGSSTAWLGVFRASNRDVQNSSHDSISSCWMVCEMWSTDTSPAPRSPTSPGVKSTSAQRPSAEPPSTKQTRLPPGSRTAGMVSSPGPTSPACGTASRAAARAMAACASGTLSAMAQTEVPCVVRWAWTKPSLWLFTTIRIAPCPHKETAFVRCLPLSLKPMAARAASKAAQLVWRTANSMNSTPSTMAGADKAADPRRACQDVGSPRRARTAASSAHPALPHAKTRHGSGR